MKNLGRRIEYRDNELRKLRKELDAATQELEDVRQKLNYSTEMSDYMKKMYTESQIQFIRYGRVSAWDKTDISNAIGLYSVSSKGYMYLREVMSYPLPSKTTLLRCLAKVDATPGDLDPVFNLLHHRFQKEPEGSKLCILGFDEMGIDPKYCYDATTDQVYGNHKLMSGIFVRGLISSWKQIIHYDFGEKISRDSLMAIIEKLKLSNCDVRGIVCDLGIRSQIRHIQLTNYTLISL